MYKFIDKVIFKVPNEDSHATRIVHSQEHMPIEHYDRLPFLDCDFDLPITIYWKPETGRSDKAWSTNYLLRIDEEGQKSKKVKFHPEKFKFLVTDDDEDN